MNPLYAVTAFFWLMLIENNTGFPGVLVDLGGGLEIRAALLLKAILLFASTWYVIKNSSGKRLPLYLVVFSLFLLFSTAYTLAVAPQHFMKAFSVNLHVQLMLNIIVYIQFSAKKTEQIVSFYKSLQFFALFNAGMVILSFVFPSLLSSFETYGDGADRARRAFGLMGDEVSLFLTFFLFDALVYSRWKPFLFYLTAILCTAGIAAFFTTAVLVGYYFIFMKKVSVPYILGAGLLVLAAGAGIFFFSGSLKEVGVFKRISQNIDDPENGSGNLRLVSLTTATGLIAQRPLLGQGYGNYGNIVYDHYAPLLKRAGMGWRIPSAMVILTSTFNPYVQMLAEAGVAGLLIFVWFLVKLYGTTRKKFIRRYAFDRYRLTVRGWLLVFFATCLSANWLLPASFLFLLIVSLIGINHAIRYSVRYV